MKDFDVKKAREIVDSLYVDELHNILVDIKSKAEQGEIVLHVYKSITQRTISNIEDKGFKVIREPSMAIQRDGLYYSIYWGDETKT